MPRKVQARCHYHLDLSCLSPIAADCLIFIMSLTIGKSPDSIDFEAKKTVSLQIETTILVTNNLYKANALSLPTRRDAALNGKLIFMLPSMAQERIFISSASSIPGPTLSFT